MKRFYIKFLCLLLIICSISCFSFNKIAWADSDTTLQEIYYIYDLNGNKIDETNRVEIGDIIITKDFKQYEIISIDESSLTAYAEYNGDYKKIKVKKGDNVNMAPNVSKSVGLYLTHNDESYVPTDNTSSVYGKGGIHNVAQSLASCFSDLGYQVYLDETLHLPHDKNAYTRSNVTATNLLENNVDALFDIHRDGVSRSVYVKNVDGIERCKVRIVVGQANPNKDANLQFAMYLVSVAEEICPWLFLDIYYAKGHYNQALTSKGLLFEMGTYLAEKELVLDTVPYLAQVVDKTLFATVADDGTIEVNPPQATTENSFITDVLDDLETQQLESKYTSNIAIFTTLAIVGISLVAITFYFMAKKKNIKLLKNKSKQK